MQQRGKIWKGLLMCVCVLMLGFSVTVFATEVEGKPEGSDTITDIVSEYKITLNASEFMYTGEEIRPELSVSYMENVLLEGTDYVITYHNNVNAGTAAVEVTGVGGYAEKLNIVEEFQIVPASMDYVQVDLGKTSYTYNGKAKEPEVKVLLNNIVVDASNYVVSYNNNTEVGTATAVVEGMGNLTGTKEVAYKIKLKAPSFSLARSYNRIRVYWGDVTGADGFQIYRSTSSDSGFKKIATVNAGDEEKYTDKDVSHNKKYYYKIRAYRTVDGQKKYSDYTKVKSITVRAGTPNITAIKKTNSTTLTVKWTDIDGASGYRVYRATSKNGEYKRIATVSGKSTVSYKDTGLVCGRTYYYKVKAYRTENGTKYNGSASEIKSSTPRPVKVKWTDEISYDATKITLKWKKAAGADGYQIWRSEKKNGEYTKVKTINSSNTLKWTDTDLTKDQNYYYKIRAFSNTDDKKTYGLYSEIFLKRKAGWRYSTYDGQKVKLYYNAKGKLVKDVHNLIGKQDSYVIKVNKQKCTVTVYAKDGDNGYIIPVKAFVCSPGQSTPLGTFYTPKKYRWHELMGPCWGQWCTRIVGGVLFHSVFYNSYNDSDSLSVGAYNKLGTICSHGCVRLTAGDAKWIYDNCELETKVIIYNDSAAGPFGKPSAVKLPYWHTWDPTDPNKFDKCDARGCH